MSTFLLQYNGVTLPAGLKPLSRDMQADIAEQERPRAPGAVSQVARKQPRILQVRGDIGPGLNYNRDTWRAAFDAIKAACYGVGVQQLFFGDSDRYYLAQCTGFTEDGDQDDGVLWGISPKVAITFKADDPDAYDVAGTQTATLSTTGGTITPGGNTDAWPNWTITIGTGGTGSITLTNTTTGETATLTAPATYNSGNGFANGDVIVLSRPSSGPYNVTLNGTQMFGLLAGIVPYLKQGANSIAASAGTPDTISALTAQYINRWL